MKRHGNSSAGFSLVELLVVTAIMGLVVMAVMGVYESTQRTAYSQDEVVELQQNLRVALEEVTKDLRLAGFMIPATSPPLQVAPQNPDTSSRLTINTASARGRAIRIDEDLTVPEAVDPDGDADTVRFTVGSSDMIDLFDAGDKVRVIRPPAQEETLDYVFTVKSTNRTSRYITLSGFTAALGGGTAEYKAGDVIVRTDQTLPDTIAYYLEGDEIKRIVKGATTPADVVADDITALTLAYLMDDGTEKNSVSGSERDEVRAVRVTVTGQTTTPEGTSTRSLSNVVKLRNR